MIAETKAFFDGFTKSFIKTLDDKLKKAGLNHKFIIRLLFGFKTTIVILVAIYGFYTLRFVLDGYFDINLLRSIGVASTGSDDREIRKVISLFRTFYSFVFFLHILLYFRDKKIPAGKMNYIKEAFSNGVITESEYKKKILDAERNESLFFLKKLEDTDHLNVKNIERFYDLVEESHRINNLKSLIEESYSAGIINKEEYTERMKIFIPLTNKAV